jgi:hypothetical protein
MSKNKKKSFPSKDTQLKEEVQIEVQLEQPNEEQAQDIELAIVEELEVEEVQEQALSLVEPTAQFEPTAHIEPIAQVDTKVEPTAKVEPKAEPKQSKREFKDNEILPFRSHKGFVFKLKYKDIVRKGYKVAEDLL